MTNIRLLQSFNKHLHDNFWLYIITVLCLFIGIVLGVYAVNYMGDYEKNGLLSYFSNFNSSTISGQAVYKEIFFSAIWNNLPLIIAIWFLGLTMVGIPIILLLDVAKGFTIGFVMTFMIKGLGMQGFGMSMLMVLPQNIIYIPCIIICSVIAMSFSISFLKNKIYNQWTSNIFGMIASYSVTFMGLFLMMTVGFILEAYVTPNIIKLVAITSGSGLA